MLGRKQPISIKLLGRLFSSEHYPVLFDGEGTHDAAIKLIAQLVRYTDDEEYLTEIIRSGLPDDYAGNTLDEIPEMIRGALKKGFQNPNKSRERKATIASAAVNLALSVAIELFHDCNRRPFISIPLGEFGQRVLPLNSGAASDWLGGLWYAKTQTALPEQARTEAIVTLRAKALYDGRECDVSVRVSKTLEAVYFDLGGSDGAVVRIDGDGWQTVAASPIKFLRSPTFGALPHPTKGGDLKSIERILRLSENSSVLVLAFLISAIRPGGPFFCLLVDGEQGSGKSLLCSTIKRFVDPNLIDKLALPNTDEQLFIQAKDSHLLVFDNASSMRNDISDALCRLATGGAIAKRRLYTDDDLHVLVQCNPFIINGIGDFVHRPDLLERAILLSLDNIDSRNRRTEQQIRDELEVALPGFLGRLFDVVSVAFRDEAATAPPADIRMADAARWLSAAEPATGLPEGTLIKAIVSSQVDSLIDRIRENSLFLALEALTAGAPYEALVGVLHDDLILRNERPDRSFPRTPAHLSNQLQRLRPAMAKAGLFIELRQKARDGRSVKIWRAGQEGMAPKKPPKPMY